MKTRKTLILYLMALVLTLPIVSTYATTKIKSVSVKIEVDDEDYEGTPELTITTKNERYSCDDYAVTNDLADVTEDDSYGGPGSEAYEDEEPAGARNPSKPYTCEITLSAKEGYAFDSMKKADIKVSGYDADCTKASRKDSGKTLVLTVELPGIKSLVGSIDEATWDENGKAKWSAANNASRYVLRLYNEDKRKGNFNTSGTEFDFSPAMLREGSYHYTVKPEGDAGNQVGWTESIAITITKEQADENLAKYRIEHVNDETINGPGSISTPLNLGWQQDSTRYYYRLSNGMYIQTDWLNEGSSWYFFDEDGYMITNDWVKYNGSYYYFGSNGKMWTNKTTPDGHKVDKEGTRIN